RGSARRVGAVVGGRRLVLVGVQAGEGGDDVTQLRELGDNAVTPALQMVDLRANLGDPALGVGLGLGHGLVGLRLRGRDHLLGLATRPREQALGLGPALVAVLGCLGDRLASALLCRLGTRLGVRDELVGLLAGRGVRVGGLLGEALLL